MNDPTHLASLSFREHGAEWFRGAIVDQLTGLQASLVTLPKNRAGLRIHGIEALRAAAAVEGPVGSIAAAVLGPGSRPVRAILFDKTPKTNWSLAWHQDRTICVRERVEVDGFGPWTVKQGMHHVAPPFALLARMVTLRLHFDEVAVTNAPLLIAPGSHTYGRVPVGSIEDIVRKCGTHTCLANAGDVWLYATPILHASHAAVTPSHRRVLQIDFAAIDLPGALEWLGV